MTGDRPLVPSALGWAARPLASVWAATAAWRRRRASRPGARHRLRRPVISIGNLSVGGRGKTPLAACLARVLLDAGERPAILSRGYGRRDARDGAVIVRDAAAIRADLDQAGDEPLMLARMLPGAIVVAGADRHVAGVLAETHLGATVHILDDGFQHLALARDVDLVLVRRTDLQGERVLPAGRLREAPEAAAVADAWLCDVSEVGEVAALAARAGVGRVFGVRRSLGAPELLEAEGTGPTDATRSPVLLVSGVADPDRVEADVRAAGWALAGHLAFPDHHRFSPRDVRHIEERAGACGATLVLTTAKDAERLLPLRPLPLSFARVPLLTTVEPADEFRKWLFDGLRLPAHGSGLHEPLNPEP